MEIFKNMQKKIGENFSKYFLMSAEKFPKSIQEKPFIILFLGIILLGLSAIIIWRWFEGLSNSLSLLSGGLSLFYGVSALYVWRAIKFKGDR